MDLKLKFKLNVNVSTSNRKLWKIGLIWRRNIPFFSRDRRLFKQRSFTGNGIIICDNCLKVKFVVVDSWASVAAAVQSIVIFLFYWLRKLETANGYVHESVLCAFHLFFFVMMNKRQFDKRLRERFSFLLLNLLLLNLLITMERNNIGTLTIICHLLRSIY